MATTQRNTDFTITGNNVAQLMGSCSMRNYDDVNHIVNGMDANVGLPHSRLNKCDINQRKRSYGTDCSIESVYGEIFDGNEPRKLTSLFGGNLFLHRKLARKSMDIGSKILEANEYIEMKWPQLQFGKYKKELFGSPTPTPGAHKELDFGELLRELQALAAMSNDGSDLDMDNLVKPQWLSLGFNTETSDRLSELTNTVKSFAQEGIKTVHKVEMGGVVKAYLLIALGTSAIIFAGKRRYFLSILSTIGVALIANEEIAEAVRNFVDYFKVKPQDGSLDFEPLINLSIMALGLKHVCKGSTKEFTQVVSNYGRLSTGGANMFSDALDLVEKIVNLFRDKVLGKDKIHFFSNCSDEIQKWIDDIDEITHKLDRNKYQIDCLNYDKVLLLKNLGDRFFKEVSKAGKEFISLKGVISVYQKKIVDILVPFKKASLDSTAQRTPPLCILLQGESGVGKSAMTVPFIDDVLVSVIQDADTLRRLEAYHMDFIYSRNYETKFWDGYRGQMVCVFDDFMQNVENVGDADGEPMNLIRAVNPFPYQLHMAHLDDKGNNYFSSKMIVATTNDYNLNSMIIKKPEALKRRFEIVLEVYPKKEYCIDPNVTLKERRLKQLVDFTFDVYEFHVKTDKLGLAPSNVLNYDDCVKFVSDAYNKRMSIGNAYLSTIGVRRAQRVKERLEELEIKPQSPSLYAKYKIKRELSRYISKSEQDIARSDIEHLFANRLCYYKTDFLDKFWESSYGASYFIYTHKPVNAMDDVEKKHIFSKEFRGFCNYKNMGCTIPARFDDCYRARYPADPQSGEKYMMDHDCPENMECFLNTLHDHNEGKLTKVDAEELASRLLNCGNICTCAHYDTAVELLMESSSKSKYNVSNLLDKARGLFKKENAFPALAGVATIIVTLKAAVSLYKMWNGVEEFANKTCAQYGEGKTSHTVRSLKSYKIVPVIKCQGGEDVEMSEKKMKHIDSLVKKNIYVAYVNGVPHPWAYVTAIKGDVFMLNAHYYHLLKKKRALNMALDIMLVPYVNVLKGDMTTTFHLNGNNLIEEYTPTETMLQNDLWLFKITNMRPHRDIIDSFITDNELDTYRENIPVLSTYLRTTDEGNIVALCKQSAVIHREGFSNSEISLTKFIRTSFESEDGDCGSLVMLDDPNFNKDKIVSMHAALAASKFALSTVITKELLISCLPYTTAILPSGVDPEFQYDNNSLLEIDLPHRYYRPEKSRLKKTPFFGVFGEPKRDIAVLSKRGDQDPYEMAIARYGTGNFHVDEKILTYAVEHYTKKLRDCKDTNKSILTMEEAIKGIAGEPYINGVCRSTSPGYPWNLTGSGGKWHIFGDGQEYDTNNDECKKLIERCNSIIRNATKGERMPHHYIDALKDELRTIEKVDMCKTRMISCAPLDLVVVMKMYFGSFVSSFISNRIFNGSAVGINPVSDEWSTLAKTILAKGQNVVAGDFSSFDATQSASTLRALVRIINDWYDDGEENRRIREILWLEVYNSLHIHGDKALMFDHSLPSGNPLTTIINTMYVNIVMRMAFIYCYENPAVLEQFDKHVNLVAYGDDNILGISDEAIEDFNYITIEKALTRLGLTYTNEDKTTITDKSKSIDECTFLKRGFRYRDGVWNAPLDLDVVTEMWYWYRQGPDEKQRVFDNIVNMMRELSLHDEEVWNDIVPKIKEETRKHEFDLLSYDQEFYRASVIASDAEIMELITNEGIRVQSGEGEVEQSKEMAGTEQGDEVSNDLTKFLSDTVVREYDLNPYADIANGLKSAPNVFPQDDVKQFLGRPINIATFTMSTSNAAGDTVWSHVLPPNDFYSPVSPLWLNKISGFMGIRGTAVLRFVIAANRFVQGRLLVHYLPGPVDGDWEKQHNRNLMTRTQQPRIDINVNRDTAAEIRFPYISPATHYNLLTREGKWGKIFATVYSPLVGYAGQLNISVFLHFEDIDLVLPTIAPQSGKFREKEALGPVSSILDVSTKVADALKGIPSLSAIATPAAWFLSYAKKTAQSLGYAVANNRDHYLRVGTGENAYCLNNDGQRIAFPMGNSNQNEVEVLSGFAGSDVDEMSLKYFAQRPAFFFSSTFDTSHITGDNIHTNVVGPLYYNEMVSDFTLSYLPGFVYTMAPVTFLTAASSYWRGSLVFNFKLVKTEFHTGKLAICFFPGVVSAQPVSQTNWTFRHVVDIKDTDEFHITVPYTSLTPWSRTTDRTGSLQIFVVNPLNCPPTVSSSISLLLEVSGGDDFAVAGISDFGGAPFTQTDFTPQSGLFKDDIRIKKFVVGDAIVKERSVDAERFAIGEAMVSVKHFTNKFKRCIGGPIAMNNPAGPYRSMTFRPFTIGGMSGTFSTKAITPSSLGNSWVDLFSSCYSIARGSMYYDFYSTETANWINYGFNSQYTGVNRPAFTYAALGATIVNTPGNQVVIDGKASTTVGHVIVNTPQWAMGHSRYVRCDNTDGARPLYPYEPSLYLTATNTIVNVLFKRSKLFKASGDDFQLGGFVGVPAMYIYGNILEPVNPDIGV